MVDTRQTPPTTKVLWVSALYAVLYNSAPSDTTLLITAVAKAFDHSPYLRTSAAQ